jgi:hypothetical protein
MDNPLETAQNPATISGITATAGVKSALLEFDVDDFQVQWGAIIFRAVGAAPTGLQTEVVAVIPVTGDTANNQYQDLNLTTGLVYHYKVQAFTTDGQKGTLSADASATPT